MNAIVKQALALLEERMRYDVVTLTSPDHVRDFLKLRLGFENEEVFGVIWLDAQHQVIQYEKLFQGTISETRVYPRIVLKRGLEVNAAACILAHNHPSGSQEPSPADLKITKDLKDLLGKVDINLLDHMIVAGSKITSFAEKGLM